MRSKRLNRQERQGRQGRQEEKLGIEFLATLAFLAVQLSFVLLLAGCGGSAVSSGHNTALDSVDLVSMTDQMATSMATDPRVNQEFTAHGPLTIVCEPVDNQLTGEIIPHGQAEAYTARVRTLLSHKAPDRFVWIMNRDEFYDLRGQELSGVSLGPAPDSIQPRYALHAVFQSLTNEDSEHRSSYYLCVYRLTDLDNRTELWSGKYEVKKNEVKGFLD
jgi:hypothetical protein